MEAGASHIGAVVLHQVEARSFARIAINVDHTLGILLITVGSLISSMHLLQIRKAVDAKQTVEIWRIF